MDLDSDYYLSRCKDINGLGVFKWTFMTQYIALKKSWINEAKLEHITHHSAIYWIPKL